MSQTDLLQIYDLDLSYNNVSSLKGYFFLNIFLVNVLNLSFNSLTNVDGDAFAGMLTVGTTASLDFSFNNLSTISFDNFLSHVYNLILSHNEFKDFKLSNLGVSVCNSLDLSFNKLLAVDDFPDAPVDSYCQNISNSGLHMAILDLSYNHIPFFGVRRKPIFNNWYIGIINISHNVLVFIGHAFSPIKGQAGSLPRTSYLDLRYCVYLYYSYKSNLC